MDSKTTGFVSYLTLIGFIVAVASGTRDEKSLTHMNNALNYLIFFGAPMVVCSILIIIPILGYLLFLLALLWCLFGDVLMIIGFINALQDKPFTFPIVGGVKLIKLPEENA